MLLTHAAAPVAVKAPIRCFDPLVPTIFHEPWWLNAVTGGHYREITIAASGGQVVGRLPLVLRRHIGGRIFCKMPDFTPLLGPAVDEGAGSTGTRLLKRAGITRELLAQVPTTTGFLQKMYAGVGDMLMFQERGFDVSVEFSYETAPLDETTLWRNMRDKTRNVIRRAREQTSVVELVDAAAFTRFYVANLLALGRDNYFPGERLDGLHAEVMKREQGRMLGCYDVDERLTAAIFYVWDARSAYYLLSTRTPDAGNGAVSLLIGEALRDSARRGLMFDFGSIARHVQSSRLLFSGFGVPVSPRFVASRYSRTQRIYEETFAPLVRGLKARLR